MNTPGKAPTVSEPKLTIGDWIAAIISFVALALILYGAFAVVAVWTYVSGSNRSAEIISAAATASVLLSGLNSVLYVRSRLRKRQRDHAKKWESARGVCAICSYDLTGNTTGTCPECGTAIPSATRPAQRP
jgi:hypothetical protein